MPESFDASKARDDRIASRAADDASSRKRRQDEQERRRSERATPRTPQERKEDREARAKAREAEKNAPVTRADLVSGVAGVLASSASRYLTRGEFEARMSAMLSGLVANLLGSNTDGNDGNLVVRGGSIDVVEFDDIARGIPPGKAAGDILMWNVDNSTWERKSTISANVCVGFEVRDNNLLARFVPARLIVEGGQYDGIILQGTVCQ